MYRVERPVLKMLVLLFSLVLASCGGSDTGSTGSASAELESNREKLFFGHDYPPYSTGGSSGIPQNEQPRNEQPSGVTVVDEVSDQPLRCRGGAQVSELVLDQPEVDLVIDGGGRNACIRVETECSTTVRARSITLNNCRYCVDLLWGGRLTLTALGGGISCESVSDGVRVRGGSSASLVASGDLRITSLRGASAIRLGHDSLVSLSAGGSCQLEGRPLVRTTGNGAVETDSCAQLMEQNPPDLGAEPSEDGEEGQPEVPPEPVPPEEPAAPAEPPVVAPPVVPEEPAAPLPIEVDEPIRCRRGSLVMERPGEDLYIDGQGRSRCIRIDRLCDAQIRARSITLTNCRECVQAGSGASLQLSAEAGDITCDAVRDAVLAERNSVVELHSANDINLIASGSNRRSDGVQAGPGSSVSLHAPGTCSVQGPGSALNAAETASIDTSGCGQLATP